MCKPLLTEVLWKARIVTADAAQSCHEFGRLVKRAGGAHCLISPLPLQPVRPVPPTQGGGRLSHIPAPLSLPFEREASPTRAGTRELGDEARSSHKQAASRKRGLHEQSYPCNDQSNPFPLPETHTSSSSDRWSDLSCTAKKGRKSDSWGRFLVTECATILTAFPDSAE